MQRSLIIEDDPGASELLAHLMRRRNFDVVQTDSGTEGLRLARELCPELVLLDLMLPDLHGYKVCESLKLHRATNSIPIVIVSAMSAREDLVEGFRVGADAYVTKPYTLVEIDQAVDAVLVRRQRLERENVDMFVAFDLSSAVGNLMSVNELLGFLLSHTALAQDEIARLRTALVEMGQNAIEWGNKNDRSKRVRIDARVTKTQIAIHVADEGQGFDPRDLPHAANGEDDDPIRHMEVRESLGLREGGFGILMTRGLVDEVFYNEKGNGVTLVKRLPHCL